MASRVPSAAAGLAVWLLSLACTHEPDVAAPDTGPWRAEWARDWNARVDAHEERRDHPCGDFRFDPWAREFLAPCETYSGSGQAMTTAECEARTAWAWERSRQCNVWQAWLLRNHHKQTRNPAPEPETRVFE